MTDAAKELLAERLRQGIDPNDIPDAEAIMDTAADEIERLRAALAAAQVGVLRKRPVAWRVATKLGKWIIFQDEKEAYEFSEKTCATIQGMYVRDGSPLMAHEWPEPERAAAQADPAGAPAVNEPKVRYIDGMTLGGERLGDWQQLGMQSTDAMRKRVRELATPPRDDFDRAVLCVLNDLEKRIEQSLSVSNTALAAAQANLLKRPVAWRVKDYGDGWIVFQDEREAYAMHEETGAKMQGLYVRSGDK
jgi:hypothetical protein